MPNGILPWMETQCSILTNEKIYSKGSLDIISEQDFKRKLERGHVKCEVTAKEVQEYGIVPVKATPKGVKVHNSVPISLLCLN